MVLGEVERTSRRKIEHIEIVLNKPVEGPQTTWFEYVFLPIRALPKVDPEKVSTSVNFLGKDMKAPLIIEAMTGGAPGTELINKSLAEVACQFSIGMGLGSQRAALESRELAYTYRIARDVCPDMVLLGNIGIAELIRYGVGILESLISMVEVDGIAVHLNYFQEVVQPEGTLGFSKGLEVISKAVDASPVPIIVKEVGFGISREFAEELYSIGVKYVDIAGAGGTNWALVELYRAASAGNITKQYIADGIKEVGIPTAASIAEVRSVSDNLFIIGSGGIRSPYDAVKALRLGANIVGMARPILLAYSRNTLREFLEAFILGFKAILASLGVTTVSDIVKSPVVVVGLLKEWLDLRGIKIL